MKIPKIGEIYEVMKSYDEDFWISARIGDKVLVVKIDNIYELIHIQCLDSSRKKYLTQMIPFHHIHECLKHLPRATAITMPEGV